MRISSASLQQIQALVAPKAVKVENTASTTSPSGPDKADISKRAHDVFTGVQAVKAEPEVREDKVAEARRKLEAGGLNLSADSIADKLLSLARKDQV